MAEISFLDARFWEIPWEAWPAASQLTALSLSARVHVCTQAWGVHISMLAQSSLLAAVLENHPRLQDETPWSPCTLSHLFHPYTHLLEGTRLPNHGLASVSLRLQRIPRYCGKL